MIQTRIMILLLMGWLWFYEAKPLYHEECPNVPITKRCIGIERVDVD